MTISFFTLLLGWNLLIFNTDTRYICVGLYRDRIISVGQENHIYDFLNNYDICNMYKLSAPGERITMLSPGFKLLDNMISRCSLNITVYKFSQKYRSSEKLKEILK